MCHICGQPFCNQSPCIQQINLPCNPNCNPCSSGPVFQMDAANVIYHKDNNTTSQLTCLGLGNGATLQLILETIDTKICQLNVPDWTLTFLRESFLINTLAQFGAAVDQTLASLQSQITAINATISGMGFKGDVTVDPTVVDGQYWFRTDLGKLYMKLNGSTREITIV